MAACLLGANAPDIDVFAPLRLPVDGIASTAARCTASSPGRMLAAGIVCHPLAGRPRSAEGDGGALPFRAGPLFVVTFLAVLTHPFLDWLTTYAIALLARLSWRWHRGTRSSSSTGSTGC